jgi:Glycosyltransferase family 87
MAATSLPARRSAAGPLAVLNALRRPVAEIAAGVQVFLAAAVVLMAAQHDSWIVSLHKGAFTHWFAGPLEGLLPGLTTDRALLQHADGDIQLAMLGAWILILLGGRAIRGPVVIASVVAVNVIFVFCPLLKGTDVFNYIGYARLDVVQHLNPYVSLPLAQHGDPVYAYSNWHRLRSPYGPLFTILMLPTAYLPVPVAYWVWKCVATLASLGLLAAVWGCARRVGRAPAQAVAFVGLNPITIVWALGGKHTEFLMMGLLTAGCLLALRRQEVIGGASLAAAAAVKATAGLLAPVIALGMPRRRMTLAGLIGGGVVFAAATYLFFGPHLPNLKDQGRLVSVTSFPNLVGYYVAGRGGADAGVRSIARILMIAGTAACALYSWRTKRWATAAGWAALIAAVTTAWLVPWYILWALPLVALSGSRPLRAVTVLMTVWFVLIWSWTAVPIMAAHGFQPRKTPVGHANFLFERSVMKDPSAVRMRKAGRPSGRAPMLPRRHASPFRSTRGNSHLRVRHRGGAQHHRTSANQR